jgi:hypothetical protein
MTTIGEKQSCARHRQDDPSIAQAAVSARLPLVDGRGHDGSVTPRGVIDQRAMDG